MTKENEVLLYIYNTRPKEMNHHIISRISNFNLEPTPLIYENLVMEGLKEGTITVIGNTVIDALYLVVNKINIKF